MTKNISSNNDTNSASEISEDPTRLPSIIILPIILFICLFGNILLVTAICRTKRLRTEISILILNLAICDIMTAVFSIPFTLADHITSREHYPLGPVLCKLIKPLATYANNTSIFTLVLIAIERYIAITVTKTFLLTKRRIMGCLVLIHILAIGSVIPYSIHMKHEWWEGNAYCYEDWIGTFEQKFYTIVLFLIQYGFPLPIMITLYSFAWRIIQKQNKKMIKMSEEYETKVTWDDRPVYHSSDETAVGSDFNVFKETSLLNIYEVNNDTQYSPRYHNGFLSPSAKSGTYSAPNLCCDGEHEKLSSSSLPVSNFHNNNHTTLQNDRHWARLQPIKRSSTFEKIKTIGKKISTFRSREFKSQVSVVRHRQTIRTLKMFIVIVTVFAVFALPNQIAWILNDFAPANKQLSLPMKLFFVVLTYVNSMTNCWIYGGFNKSFRRAYIQIFVSLFNCCRKNTKSQFENKHIIVSAYDDEEDERVKNRHIAFTNLFEQHANGFDNVKHLYNNIGNSSSTPNGEVSFE